MTYSELINEIKDKNNIYDIVSEYISVEKKKDLYLGICPFHKENTKSLIVYPDKQIYHCPICNETGNVIDFVKKYKNITYREAIKEFADSKGISTRSVFSSEATIKKYERIKALLKDAAVFYNAMLKTEAGKDGLNYFTERKLSLDTIYSFGLGYAGEKNKVCDYLLKKGYTEDEIVSSGIGKKYKDDGKVYDKLNRRIIFPILDRFNTVVGFGGRRITEDDEIPKYINSPETRIFKKRNVLFGLNKAVRSKKKYFIICEGYMDVISMHQAGFIETVAPLGTAFTENHASLIKKYVNNVKLTFDSDEAGIQAAYKTVPKLKALKITAQVIDLSPYKDPDEFIKNLGKKEFQKRIDEAEDINVWIEKMRNNKSDEE